MIEKLKNSNLFAEKDFAVIAVVYGEQITYQGILVSREKGSLTLIKDFEVSSLDTLEDHIKKTIPVILNFSGKGILGKKVKLQGNYLKEVIFNADPDSFFMYEVHQQNEVCIAIGRKEVLTQEFDKFQEQGYLIIDYSIGDFVGMLCRDFIKEQQLISRSIEIEIQNESITYKKASERNHTYLLGEDRISSEHIPLLGTMLQHLYPQEQVQYEVDFLAENIQEAKMKKLFEVTGLSIGIFFLVALLTSYLLLGYYNDQYVAYESQLYNLNHTYNQVKKLEEEKENKSLLLRQSGVLKDKFLSYYVQQIAHTVPKTIQLEELKINPNTKKIKNHKKIDFDNNTIVISGISNSSVILNTWVKKLRKEKWILQLEILDFSNKRRQKGAFTLKIKIK